MQKNNTKARTSAQNLMVLFVIFLLISATGYFIINKDNQKSFAELSSVQQLNQEKMQTLMLMVAKLGYGEMIHNFKNFIIRGEKDYRTSSYPKAFADDVEALKEAKAHYLSLTPISDYEKEHLAIVEKTIQEYVLQMEKAKELKAQDISIAEIDRQVVVDDRPAMKALEEIEAYVAQNTLKVIEKQTSEASNTLLVELAIVLIALLAVMAIAFEWLINRQIIQPLRKISQEINSSCNFEGEVGACHYTVAGVRETRELANRLQTMVDSIHEHQEHVNIIKTTVTKVAQMS